MIKAQLVFCRLEAVLDGPAAALHTDQFLDRGSCRSPGGEEGQVLIRDRAPDQQAARPKPGAAGVVFAGVDIGQFHISPVIEARPLGALATDRRFQSEGAKPCATLSAVPAMGSALPQEVTR